MKKSNFDEYQKQANLASDMQDNHGRGRIVIAALGLGEESGELAKLVKDSVISGKKIDLQYAGEWLGDILWYVAEACSALDISFQDVAETNIQKLKKRKLNER